MVEPMKPESLTNFCQRQLERTVDFLREMVSINSFTANRTGVNLLGELTAERFRPLGFQPLFIDPSHADHGRHLVLRRGAHNAPTIAMVSHLDTVFPEAEEAQNDFRWRVEPPRIYGPGTNDIKGGTALMRMVLSAFAAQAPALFDAVQWVLLFNACEEVISKDFAAICRAHLRPERTLACLIFEADGGEGGNFSLVRARKGRATFRIEVAGRGAHAGTQHHRGANAIVQLADIVGRIAALTDYHAHLTVNIAAIEGGTVANRVPHIARAHGEMRAFDPIVYQNARAQILSMAGVGSLRSADDDQHPCEVFVQWEDETQPWPRNVATDELIALWRSTGEQLGVIVQAEDRGGLSDGNVTWEHFPTIDGLGPRGDNSHCSERSADGKKEQEWVDLESFVPKAVLNAIAIERLITKAADRR
jgi:glutamate carboxypeptidase